LILQDENFKELSTPVSFPRTEPNPLTINTIAKRAPELSNLKLNFYLATRKFSNPEALRNFGQSLAAPKNLTSLTLCQLSKKHRAILQYLGNSCPKLKYLSLTGFRFNRNDVLSLILGEVLQLLPDTQKEFLCEDDEEIHGLQIPPRFLTSFCATLEHLQLEAEDAEKKKLQTSFEYTGLCHFAVAFAFRHFPKLQKFNHSGSSTSSAVKLLYHLGNNGDNEMEHENIYQENSQNLLLSWTIKTPFSGKLL